MDSKSRLAETAARVRDLTPARVSELTGIKSRRLARFTNQPESITFTELMRIRAAIDSEELPSAQ